MKKNITISTGNKKLKSTKEVRFLIWNIPAIITCPYATEHCKEKCYAIKAERMYPDCKPCRERNLDSSRSDSFVDDMKAILSRRMKHPVYKNAKKIYFRIHESGDFYNQAYFDKWVEIARAFPKVHFLAYTKSLKFVLNRWNEIPANFVIRFSLWDDTNKEDAKKAAEMGMPTYTAWEMTADEIKALGNRYCDCVDCGKCGKCYSKKVKDIVCEIH